jgi:hypothetical protein
MTAMLESQIEKKGGELAKKRNIQHLKFTSPNRVAVPDRLLLAEIPEFMRPIFAKYVRFVEYKARGKKATAAQEREHARLRALGFTVDVVDSVTGAEAVINAMGDL